MSKTFSTIVQQMRTFIRSKFSNLDTSEGTILNDIVISAPAQELEKMYDQLDTISDAQAIDTAGISALELLARNFGLERKGARKAEGSITFFVSAAPTTDTTVSVGSVVSTVSSTASPALQFVVTRSVTMYASLASTYLNTFTGKYEISTDIQASTPGENSNIGASTLTTLITSITGIDGCYNSVATSGGSDSETEEQLRIRIAARVRGAEIATADGYLSVVLAQDGVEDATVVGHGNTGRDDIGAVDIYVKGKVTRTQSDSFFTIQDLVLSKQPVLLDGVISVISSASGSLSNWELSKDIGAYGGSVQAQDTVSWTSPIDATYGALFVSYNYNGLVEDLQSLFLGTNRDVLNVSLLVRWATEIPIDVTCRIQVLAGFDTTDVITSVTTAITQFLNALSIGEELQQGDVAREILNTSGVDDVTLPFTTFRSSDSSITQNANGNLELPSNGYASTGTITINLIS